MGNGPFLFINGEGSYPVVGDAIEFDISDFCQGHLIFSQMSPGILSAAYYRHRIRYAYR